MIKVCSPKHNVPDGAIKLSVASHAPCQNPSGWKDLWKLSPFSLVDGGVSVPGLEGSKSKTVENAWQFLKIWNHNDGWDKDTAMEGFDSDCAMRFPKGKNAKAIGSYWGATEKSIGYIEARYRIYLPCYLQMLELPDRQDLVARLRVLSKEQDVYIWDYDSYRIDEFGLSSFQDTIDFEGRPFAHAFIVAMQINGEIAELIQKSESRFGKICS